MNLRLSVAPMKWILACTFVMLTVQQGCAHDDQPHPRIGALPFPGIMTLYEPSELSELGTHRYANWWERPLDNEGARGIMYTERAGFIDLAHLRESVDWTRYLRRHAHLLFSNGGGTWRFNAEETEFELRITLPAWWDGLDRNEKEKLADAACLKIGQRAAYELAIWHEIATWYGWETIPLISETGSAFTCEDLTSNLLGVLIAADITDENEEEYDHRATASIRRVLQELSPVSRQDVDRAADSVKGMWWRDGVAIRRNLETGLDSGYKQPWLATSLEVVSPEKTQGEHAVSFKVPDLHDVGGRNLSDVYELRITPAAWLLKKCSASQEAYFIADRDLASLVSEIDRQVLDLWGPSADKTSPARASDLRISAK